MKFTYSLSTIIAAGRVVIFCFLSDASAIVSDLL